MILDVILNILKRIAQIKQILKLVKENKLYASIFLIASFSTCYFSSDIIKKIIHNRSYDISVDYDNTIYFIDNILKECGDKTGVTISPISLNLDYSSDFYKGRFYIARACDSSEIKNDCIVNLKDIQPTLYAVDQHIDLNSYQLLLRLGNQTNSSRFYLRDKNNKQNIASLDRYPSIKYVVENTDWFRQGSLYNLWVTSILSNNNVLYVITYLSGTSMEKSECFDPNLILNEIKNFIKK
jgi:hypothetical protein